MKISIPSFIVCLVALLAAQMPQNATAQADKYPFRLWKDGKIVAQTTTPVDSIVMSVKPTPAPKSQVLNEGGVGGAAPTAEQAIDMGLSVKWAPWNVGASKAEENGAYFAWGEINTKETYDWGTYYWMAEGKSNWININKYQIKDGQTDGYWYDNVGEFIGDGKSTLEREDDAATANWGSGWRMPTMAELAELMNEDNCTWTWVENYNDSDLNGYEVKSKTTAGLLFLPAAGRRWDSSLGYAGYRGYYWSSELYSGHAGYARYLRFSSSTRGSYRSNRRNGFSVRAVAVSAE